MQRPHTAIMGSIMFRRDIKSREKSPEAKVQGALCRFAIDPPVIFPAEAQRRKATLQIRARILGIHLI